MLPRCVILLAVEQIYLVEQSVDEVEVRGDIEEQFLAGQWNIRVLKIADLENLKITLAFIFRHLIELDS